MGQRDDWQGIDLTTCFEEVARKQHERLRADAVGRGFDPDQIPEWDNYPRVEKMRVKEALIPVITDTIDTALTQWNNGFAAKLRVLIAEGYEMEEAGYDALLVGLELLAKEYESPNG